MVERPGCSVGVLHVSVASLHRPHVHPMAVGSQAGLVDRDDGAEAFPAGRMALSTAGGLEHALALRGERRIDWTRKWWGRLVGEPALETIEVVERDALGGRAVTQRGALHHLAQILVEPIPVIIPARGRGQLPERQEVR